MFVNFLTNLYLHLTQVCNLTNGTHIMKEINELGEIKPKIHGFFSLSTQNMPCFLPHDVVPYRQNI